MSEATTSARMVRRLQVLIDRDLDRARGAGLLRSVGIDPRELEDPRGRIAEAAVYAAIERIAEHRGAAGLGKAIAEIRDEETYDAAGMLLLASPTLREGLARAFRYQRLWGDGERFALLPVRGGAAIRFSLSGPARLAHAVLAECALEETLAGARFLLGRPVVPLRVSFGHAALEGRAHASATPLGLRATAAAASGGPNEIVLADADLDAPLLHANAVFAALFEGQAARAVERLPGRRSAQARVREIVRRDLSTGNIDLDGVARRLGYPPRTLQRRLLAEGSGFGEIVDQERRGLIALLEARGTPVGEMAYLAGFRDPSALRRARARWARG